MGVLSSLEIGARRPLLVRRETVSGLSPGRRLLFASDLHLRAAGPQHIIEGLAGIAERERPEMILLGGDLVDRRSGLGPLRWLVREMRRVAPVAAVGGNHDRWIGLDSVRGAVVESGGHWLEDTPLQVTTDLAFYGSPRQPLLSARYHILCAHHPHASAVHAGFQLVLSGHLHGGQFVFFQHRGLLYPGALAYRWNGLRFEENGTTLVLSRGVQDTLPLRWNCPREVVVVESPGAARYASSSSSP